MNQHDLVIIGAGPGGYVAAIRAAQLGMNVACIEKEPQLGGTCLRVGCIPSKALLESSHHYEQAVEEFEAHGINIESVKLDLKKMMARKDKVVKDLTTGIAGLFKKNKITHYPGTASFKDNNTLIITDGDKTQEVSGKNIIIATGSKVAQLKGVEVDGDRIGTSTEALSYPEVPEHLIVIGAGVIGLELGSVWRRLGSKVTVLEYLDRILPGMDEAIAKQAQKLFKRQGIEFKLGMKVTGATVKGKKCEVTCEGQDPLKADRVILAVGRVPNTDGLGLENAGIDCDERGRVKVNGRYQTNIQNVFAIGDVIEGPMLAHKAEEDGIACVQMIAGKHGHVDYNLVPGVVYTHPEIATIGKTEEQLKEAGVEYRKGEFPFMASGRARAMNETNGLIKVLADAKTDRILGVHMIGLNVGELIAEAGVAMATGCSSEDLAMICHAHPTLSEVLKEAALGVDNRTIHI